MELTTTSWEKTHVHHVTVSSIRHCWLKTQVWCQLPVLPHTSSVLSIRFPRSHAPRGTQAGTLRVEDRFVAMQSMSFATTDATQSVPTCVPTRSVGTRGKHDFSRRTKSSDCTIVRSRVCKISRECEELCAVGKHACVNQHRLILCICLPRRLGGRQVRLIESRFFCISPYQSMIGMEVCLVGSLLVRLYYAKISCTTSPLTSVKRKSRLWKRYVRRR
jgi:hypothetical protein